MEKTRVFKIGGNVVDNPAKAEEFLKEFSALEGPKVLIHGGGVMASQLQKKMGMTPQMIGGRRVTDKETLDIVTMVYAGLCNKRIVATLQKYGCNAIGLSGADGGVIKAVRRPPVFVEEAAQTVDFGFVGDIYPEGVDADFIIRLTELGMTPVFCAITCSEDFSLLNTNADSVASGVAIGLASKRDVELVYCFEKQGVLMDKDDEDSLIGRITPDYFAELKSKGIVADGMLPKIENSFKAIRAGVKRVVIKSSDNIGNDIQTTLEID